MSIEFKCGDCASTLRVPTGAEGQQTRCPKCGLVQPIPVATEDEQVEAPGEPATESIVQANDDQDSFASPTDDVEPKEVAAVGEWYVKTPDEAKYGPATFAELQQWVKEGRIIAGCSLREPGSTAWQIAEDYFPDLPSLPTDEARQSELKETSSVNGPLLPNTHNVERPAANGALAPLAGSPHSSPVLSASDMEPHRAGVILALGILGLLITCPLFSGIAWSMGASDLKKMGAGQMDPAGREMTYSGYVLGKLYSIIFLIGATIAILIYALSVN